MGSKKIFHGPVADYEPYVLVNFGIALRVGGILFRKFLALHLKLLSVDFLLAENLGLNLYESNSSQSCFVLVF